MTELVAKLKCTDCGHMYPSNSLGCGCKAALGGYKSGSDTLPSKKLQPHSRLYVVSPEQWKESSIALEAEVVRLEIELRDTKRAFELMAKCNYSVSRDSAIAEFLETARKERTQV